MRISRYIVVLMAGLIFASLVSTARAAEGELLLFANPSLRNIDWSTPGNAIRSSVWGQFHNEISHYHPDTVTAAVGHIVVHFDCEDSRGGRHDVWTGMTGQNDFSETKNDLFKDGMGIGVLYKGYKDGSIDPSEKSRGQVANYYGHFDNGNLFTRKRVQPKFFRVGVDAAACDRIVRFYDTYRALGWDKGEDLRVHRQKPAAKVLTFGFAIDPYDAYKKRVAGDSSVALGGGCSSFAVAFLKVAGRFDSFLDKKWTREVDVSEKLIGGAQAKISGNRVSVLGLAVGSEGRSWNVAGYPNRPLRFYDVQKVWDFLGEAQECLEGAGDCPADTRRWLGRQGFAASDTYRFDATRTQIVRTPVGHDPRRERWPLSATGWKDKNVTSKIQVERAGVSLIR